MILMQLYVHLSIYKFMICVLLPINLDQLTCWSS